MADGFVEALARWLDDTSPMPVVMAEHARRLVRARSTWRRPA